MIGTASKVEMKQVAVVVSGQQFQRAGPTGDGTEICRRGQGKTGKGLETGTTNGEMAGGFPKGEIIVSGTQAGKKAM